VFSHAAAVSGFLIFDAEDGVGVMDGVVTAILFVGVGLVDSNKTSTQQDTATGQSPRRSLGQPMESLRVEASDLRKGPLTGIFSIHKAILGDRI
jgi:hypothetical protein